LRMKTGAREERPFQFPRSVDAGRIQKEQQMTSNAPTISTQYAFHPLANEFPPMAGGEYAELIRDIREHGLNEPITVYEDKILDGRNRYRACLEAGVEPRFTTFKGDDPIAFVISQNIRRRHLAAAQKRKYIEALLKANPQSSDRQLSKLAGASPTTVGSQRAKLESTVQSGQLPKRVGADGKARKRPAPKPIKLSVVKAVETAVAAKPAKTTAAAARGDIGPASSGEVARLEALVEELRNKNCLLESKIIGLEGEIQDLKDARPAGAFTVLLSLAKAGADAAVLTANSPDLHVVVDWLIKAEIKLSEAKTTSAKTAKLETGVTS
jgi:ParB-like chromosome segregation protein Spo0J